MTPAATAPTTSAFARVRFVLVEPTLAANIGAAARAVKTMGFARLAVVRPRSAAFREDADALALATGAADVVAAASSADSLNGALDGVALAVALTGYDRQYGPPLRDVRDVAGEAAARLASHDGDVAFVFGTERSGLANDDVLRCQIACAIPADPAFASLNLAQAVQVVAYEAALALRGSAGIHAGQLRFGAPDAPAPVAALEKLYAHFEQAATAVGFHDPAEPKTFMVRLRRLINRAQPSQTEVDLLRGFLAAVIQRRDERAGRKRG
jgi:tRNA/rRNA methyltransferase